jgi:hypothetical protein
MSLLRQMVLLVALNQCEVLVGALRASICIGRARQQMRRNQLTNRIAPGFKLLTLHGRCHALEGFGALAPHGRCKRLSIFATLAPEAAAAAASSGEIGSGRSLLWDRLILRFYFTKGPFHLKLHPLSWRPLGIK